jgi:hypothetical protein
MNSLTDSLVNGRWEKHARSGLPAVVVCTAAMKGAARRFVGSASPESGGQAQVNESRLPARVA